jgi:hypothetical protein
MGLAQPFVLSAEIAERFSYTEAAEGSAAQAPGGKVGGKVANKDEHAYIDVLFLIN